MYLKKISIKNFRVFGEQGIAVIFNKGVNAIIGENNSGKSALIDAIRIAFATIPYNKDIYFTKADFHINAKGERAQNAQFDIFLGEVPKYLIEIWNPEEPHTTGEFHIQFYLALTPAGIEKVKYKAWGGKTEGNTLSSETFDAINIAFLAALRDAESEMRPSRSSKLANLLNAIATSEVTKNELVEELLKANNTILAKEPIKKTKEIINSNLLDIEQDLLRQQIDIGLVNPKFESIASSLRSWIVPRWFFIGDDYPYYATLCEKCKELTFSKLIQKTNDGMYIDVNGVLQSDIDKELSSSLSSLMGHSFELYQNGLGYNNILFMSAVLGDMSLDRNGVSLNLFIVEEPEAHLHPQLQELIHRFFERRHDESSFVQIIYTSHSPTLVSRIGISAINLLFEVDHSVQCYPLANAKLEESEKDYLEKYLDVTKSQMFFAKGIIFVEGISEALLLPEMAKLLKRPFDKFAVEIVNINGTSFKPFAKILTLPTGVKCFARAAIITDDDRCTNIYEPTTYINKDLDFDVDLADIKQRLQKGTASARYDDMDELCVSANIELYGAFKTFEYELASEPNNIPYILEVTSDIFPKIGLKLRNLVEDETESINKAMRIWLFIRSRENIKGQIAQSLCRILQKQIRDINTGIQVMNPFVVPSYIAKAIYSVTEPEC